MPLEKEREKKMRARGKKKKKKAWEKKKNYWPTKLTPGGHFHPIHEIAEPDFLDGALVGAGSPPSIEITSQTNYTKSETGRWLSVPPKGRGKKERAAKKPQ